MITKLQRQYSDIAIDAPFSPCADPESFARGGPILILKKGIALNSVHQFQIALKAGHHRPASELSFKWLFAGRSMIAHN